MNRRGRRGFIDRLTAPDALIVQPDLKEHARLVAARVEGNPLGRVEALNAQPRLLADSEEMLCWRLCEELEKDKRLSIAEIPNL